MVISPRAWRRSRVDQRGSLTTVQCDVGREEEEVAALFRAVQGDSNLGRIDVCVPFHFPLVIAGSLNL